MSDGIIHSVWHFIYLSIKIIYKIFERRGIFEKIIECDFCPFIFVNECLFSK